MAHPRISAQLPPDIDPTKAPVAFGRRGLPKLNEELQHPELLTRQRALMALCDLVHDPENAYQAIGLGFLENLKKLLLDEDKTVRQKTTEVLYIMATHSIGREPAGEPVSEVLFSEFQPCAALSSKGPLWQAGLAMESSHPPCKSHVLGLRLPPSGAASSEREQLLSDWL
ncbi:radial spoke head 14 like [Crotalus adamanteus]|uniref:Radial spoke head 14 like n=1 Tax=Crotalus adamanteus TaxID=8729 RepID=A0AAW1ANS5_CROAD